MLQRPSVKTSRAIAYAGAVAMMVLLIRSLHSRGGPYLEIPRTVYDHVTPGPVHLSRQAIVMAEQAGPLMPRGSTLTVVAPELAPNYDVTHYLTVVGFLPRHRVLHPTLGEGEHWPDYVIALGKPFEHRGYRLVREWPEGRLYRRTE